MAKAEIPQHLRPYHEARWNEWQERVAEERAEATRRNVAREQEDKRQRHDCRKRTGNAIVGIYEVLKMWCRFGFY